MSKVNVLPEYIANKIAAGEVVQRPASVVKELVENSIDANSTKISIEVIDGGKNLILVVDNGCGMNKEDALLSFYRHATSKITTEDDLDNITSFGFRGEALPSIAAVSRVELITRTIETINGVLIKIEGGNVIDVREVGAPIGTSINISNLFFNTPARRKFLKTIPTEMGHISHIVSQEAISHPHIAFKLIHNGQEIINTPATNDLLERVADFLGQELAKLLIPIEFRNDMIEITGFLAPPAYTRPNRDYQSMFINNRYITSKTITHSLYTGYQTLLQRDRHPIAVIFIKIDPALVDVNVHPTKSEVRFVKEHQVHDCLVEAISMTLVKTNLIPSIIFSERVMQESNTGALSMNGLTKQQKMVKGAIDRYFERQSQSNTEYKMQNLGYKIPFMSVKSSDSDINNYCQKQYFPIAQIHNAYILAQNHEGLFIIDQHAAHERVLYERLIAEFKESNIPAQLLLIPITINTDYKASATLIQNLTLFKTLGFEIEEFGQNTFIIRSVPIVADKTDTEELVFDLINEIQLIGRAKDTQELKEKIIISLSCHSAIKAGEKLNQQEIESLLHQLEEANLPYTCPHGRPTIINISFDELEKRFGRT